MKTSLNLDHIKSVLKQYTSEQILQKPRQIIGDQDLNYKLTTSSRTYLLKYIQSEKDIPFFEFLGEIHTQLIKDGVPVPMIYKSGSGKYVSNSSLLYEFIDGKTKKRWSKGELQSLAKNIAKLHKAFENIPVPNIVKNKNDDYINAENVEYSRKNIMPEVFRLDLMVELKKELIDTLAVLETNLKEYRSLKKHIIHGDLNEANALFRSNTNVGIIDITLKYEALVFDLGIVLYWWAFPWWTKKFNFSKAKTIIESYQYVRKLTQLEKKLLPFLILRRSLLVLTIPIIRYMKKQILHNALEKQIQEGVYRNKEIRNSIPKLVTILQ